MSGQVCGKKYATPLPFNPSSPSPPPHCTYHPSANCPGPMISGLLDHVTPRPMAVAPLVHSIGNRSVPCPPLPAQCRQNRLFRLAASGEKGLSLLEGLGKEYMTWPETSGGKNRHSS
jgi:hypothetical protein